MNYVLPLSLLWVGTGVRLGEGLAPRWCDMPELDDPAVEYAVFRVCGTMVKRGNCRRFVRTAVSGGGDEAGQLFLIGDRIVDTDHAQYALAVMREGTALDWFCGAHLRDTTVTEVAGRSGDKARASAQLGHSEGSSTATRHYIDKCGSERKAIDNSQWLEYLNPKSDGKVTILARFPQSAAA
ncbi:hypothetical protein ACGF5S_13560 [Nocardia nova]|uniref:hypothetical protein n=1 Tax=Nocardia nova TaxID=37330 RepID=UPI00371F57BA